MMTGGFIPCAITLASETFFKYIGKSLCFSTFHNGVWDLEFFGGFSTTDCFESVMENQVFWVLILRTTVLLNGSSLVLFLAHCIKLSICKNHIEQYYK
jgi:ABC-type polysaccharide transport system permease subunit